MAYLQSRDSGGSWPLSALFLLYWLLVHGGGRLGRSIILVKEKTMPTGTVKFFNVDKGFGFIMPDGGSGNDAFVHISAVQKAGMSTLNKDQRLSYDLENDARGKTSAVNLQTA